MRTHSKLSTTPNQPQPEAYQPMAENANGLSQVEGKSTRKSVPILALPLIDSAKQAIDILLKNCALSIDLLNATHCLHAEQNHPITALFKGQTITELPEAEHLANCINYNQADTLNFYIQEQMEATPVTVLLIRAFLEKPEIFNNSFLMKSTNKEQQKLQKITTFLVKTLLSHHTARLALNSLLPEELITLLHFSSNKTEDYEWQKELALVLLNNDCDHFPSLPLKLQLNRQFVQEAIIYNPDCIAFTQENFQQDPHLNKIYNFRLGRSGLDANSEASEKNNPMLVKAAVLCHGLSLRFASDHLKNDAQIVSAAVSDTGSALQFASPSLRDNEEMVLQASLGNLSPGFRYASDRIRSDLNTVLSIVSVNGGQLQFASDELKANPTVVLQAVENQGDALQFAIEALQNDFKIVLTAVKQHGNALQYASSTLKNNRDIVLAAIKQTPFARRYASPLLQQDTYLTHLAFNHSLYGLRFSPWLANGQLDPVGERFFQAWLRNTR